MNKLFISAFPTYGAIFIKMAHPPTNPYNFFSCGAKLDPKTTDLNLKLGSNSKGPGSDSIIEKRNIPQPSFTN